MHPNDPNSVNKIIHKNISYRVNGLCFKVHNDLGRFCREKQYADKLEELLIKKNIPYEREVELHRISSSTLKGNRIDFLIDGKVIVDLKAKRFITKQDYYQILRYLESSDLELGLIVNFRNSYLKPKRVLNSKYSGHSDIHSGHSGRARGFTIIELLIVIAIVAIIGGTTIPLGANFLVRSHVENKTNELVSSLRTAQLNTISGKEDSQWGVNITSTQIILFAGASYAARDSTFDQIFSIPGSVTITTDEIIFSKLTGDPDATASLTVSAGGAGNSTVSVNEVGTVDVN
jgi:GxxExxY protein